MQGVKVGGAHFVDDVPADVDGGGGGGCRDGKRQVKAGPVFCAVEVIGVFVNPGAGAVLVSNRQHGAAVVCRSDIVGFDIRGEVVRFTLNLASVVISYLTHVCRAIRVQVNIRVGFHWTYYIVTWSFVCIIISLCLVVVNAGYP